RARWFLSQQFCRRRSDRMPRLRAREVGLPAFKPNGRQRGSDDMITQAVRAAATGQGRSNSKGKIVATYDYTDARRSLLYQVLRYEPKDFRQRRPDGNGKWIWKLDDQRVVYRWSELLKYPEATVFITEGEKDADRLAELNLCATTVATGKWTEGCIKALAGRDVVILQDNDDTGHKKAIEAATALQGSAKTIRIIALPDLPDRGDVSDWLDADPSRAKKFVDVCFDAPLWKTTNSKTEKPETTDTSPALPFINISAWQDRLVPERQWTVKDRIPASNVPLLSGEGSVGKSILS